MRRALAAFVFTLTVMVGTGAIASADAEDYESNPGRQRSFEVSCNAGHGAFGFFEGDRGGFVPEAAQAGGIGDTTGPANSGAAATCRAQ